MLHFPMNIILFDGVCNLCDFSVGFIIEHDSKAYFHFASQESIIGRELIEKYNLGDIDSLVLISNSRAYTHSDAVLEIARNLDGYYKYFYIFRFFPRVLRDVLYRFVAKYRYRVFGKRESCMIPSDEINKRFLSTPTKNIKK